MSPRVVVLPEFTPVGLPTGAAHLRLLRPLAHPRVRGQIHVDVWPTYTGEEADLVIVDRLWRPRVDRRQAEALVRDVRRGKARLVLHLDDDLWALPPERASDLPEGFQAVLDLWLTEADAVWVSTQTLADRLRDRASRVQVLQPALDEQLLIRRDWSTLPRPPGRGRIVLGYMGTATHDEDLALVIPALAEVAAQREGQVALEVVGGVARPETREALAGLPMPVHFWQGYPVEYPAFLLWFTGHVRWDIALAPLAATPFNQAKSDVKFLDYAALGAAVVASREPVYGRTVHHRVTGWLVDNRTEAWVQALLHLIDHPEERIRLARDARAFLLRERTLDRRAGDWLRAIQAVLHG